MTCRVIADFTFKEGWCEKIRVMVKDEKMVFLTANFEGCIDIDMDNPNRMILTETWEESEHHSKYMEFRQTEGPEGVVAQILDNLCQEPVFSWSDVDYKGQ